MAAQTLASLKRENAALRLALGGSVTSAPASTKAASPFIVARRERAATLIAAGSHRACGVKGCTGIMSVLRTTTIKGVPACGRNAHSGKYDRK